MRNSTIIQRLYEKYGTKYATCLLNALSAAVTSVKASPHAVALFNIFTICGSVNLCMDMLDICGKKDRDETEEATCYTFTHNVILWVNNHAQFTDMHMRDMLRIIHDMLNIYEEIMPIADMVGIGLIELTDGVHRMLLLVAFGIDDDYYESINRVINVIHREIGNVTVRWIRVVPSESQYEKLIRLAAEKYAQYGENNGAGTYHII